MDTVARQVEEFIRRIPKIELHCHLLGTLRPETCLAITTANGMKLPADVHHIYERINRVVPLEDRYRHTRVPMAGPSPEEERAEWFSVLDLFNLIGPALRESKDFARLIYEALEDAVRNSNVRYCEMFFEAMIYLGNGVPYSTIVDGLIEGARAAEMDFGVVCRLIAGINRSQPAALALELVDQMIAHPRDEVIGIGLEDLETVGPPAKFVEVYRTAKKAGLHRTAHSAEMVPSAQNIVTCLDLLECERIDHGYFVLEDPEVVARCRDDGVHFISMCTSSRRSWRQWRRNSIRMMVEQGLRVTFGADDPAMFPTTLAGEYRIGAAELGFSPAVLREMCLNAVDASWLDDGEKRRYRSQFIAEIDRINSELLPQQQTAGPGA